MTYLLVLQWRERMPSLDRVIEVEELLAKELLSASVEADCDGHDIGRSECNIFVFTKKPETVFELAHALIRAEREEAGFAAAFRPRDGEEFRILWPRSLTSFDVT